MSSEATTPPERPIDVPSPTEAPLARVDFSPLLTPAPPTAKAPVEVPAPVSRRAWILALAGPAALGVALAARDVGAASEVLRLPLIWVGVAALMMPALYIGAALSGLSPSAREVGGAAIDALSRGGGLLLGLAPALLFLVVTSFAADTATGLVALAAGLGAFAALAVLFQRLCVAPDAGVTARFVFFGWAAVLLGIGTQLYTLGQA